MEIKRNISRFNFDSCTVSRIEYIVIHYTANNGDTAKGNTEYFKSYRGSSAHYFVDENEIWQSVEDRNIAWHCGANSYVHPKCRNMNSIGIELCSRKSSNGTYYFEEKTVNNAVELVRFLMKKYNISPEKVVRHYDVTKKICPEPFVRDVKAWEGFKQKVCDDEVVEKKIIRICGKDRLCDVIFKDGFNFVKLQDLNKEDRIAVTYDAVNKIPKIDVK